MLPIHAKPLGRLDTLLPAFAKVSVIKGYSHRFADRFPDRPDEFVFLKPAIEQGRGEIGEFTPFGQQGGGSQPIMIAVPASIRFSIHHILDKAFEVVTLLDDDFEVDLVCIFLQGVLPSFTLRIRVNIMTIKKAHDLKIFVPKHFGRVNSTWAAAGVQ